jgi:hypothetical protein
VRFFGAAAGVEDLCAVVRCVGRVAAASGAGPSNETARARRAVMGAFRRILYVRGAERQSKFYVMRKVRPV